jgi:L-iditol 2-dehydrogenase
VKGIRTNVRFPFIPGHEPSGVIEAVELMVRLLRRGARWNLFGVTTHERFELDGGLAHFLEARMDASFGTTPLAMQKAIGLMETGTVDAGQIITHRFPLDRIDEALEALEALAGPESTKVIVNP